jgi:hypothetical protein
MDNVRTTVGLFVIIPCLLLLVQGCASSNSGSFRQVPENGYEHTTNYRFQAQVHTDAQNRCQRIVIRVRAVNKVYTRGQQPPYRLQLADEDCNSPVRFENARYISEEGTIVQLSGNEVDRFLGENTQLENELISWLWREGVI